MSALSPPAPPNTLQPSFYTFVEATPFPAQPSGGLTVVSFNGTVPSTGRRFTAHMATLRDPARFSVEVASNGCTQHRKTSVTAAEFNCEYATNAGFFGYPVVSAGQLAEHDAQVTHVASLVRLQGGCIGNLIINSTAKQLANTNRANFGLSLDTHTIVTGIITEADLQSHKFQFSQLVQGGDEHSHRQPRTTIVMG